MNVAAAYGYGFTDLVCMWWAQVCVLVGQFVLTHCWFASPQQPSWSLKYLVLGLSFDNKHDSNKGIMNSDFEKWTIKEQHFSSFIFIN